VDFVRFVGDEVVRVETMKVDGQKIVRTDREIVLDQPDKDKDQEAKKEPTERPANAQSLKRPGETSEGDPKLDNGPSRQPIAPLPPDLPPPASGPGALVSAR
jgi:hypothetical protein